MRVTRDAVRAARVAALGLAERVPAGRAASAAAPGLRDTPAGVFRDAVAARVEPATESNRRLISDGGTNRQVDDGLVGVWGPRAAPYVVAQGDLAVFTRGALPVDEASARAFAPSAVKALDPHGIALLDAFAEVERAMRAAVADGPVERDDMHEQLREALPPALLWACKGCGTRHVHPVLWRAACTMGSVRRDDASASRAVTYAAVASPPGRAGDTEARAELTRRAVHHHGPLTQAELAAWLSVSKADARARLEAVAGELEEVDRAGDAAWALSKDADALADPPAITGVRLLAAGDPLLDGRDRASVVADATAQKEVWKMISSPGVVLADGNVAGTWRAKAKGKRLEVTLSSLGGARLPAAARVAPEADALAAGRGLEGAAVTRS